MATYSELIGKRVESFDNDPTKSITYTVTVASSDGQNRYFIDGVQQKQLRLYEGITYNFDYSAASSHPFRFSTTNDGTHNSGSEYTTGVSVANNITTIAVATGAPNLFYYCSSHSGMGGRANTPTQTSVAAQMWYNEDTSTFKSAVKLDAFISGTPMPTAKSTWHRAGTMTAGLFCAGNSSTGFTTTTEEWNGSGFSQGGAIGTALYSNTGFGTQTAGASAAGRPTNPSSGDTNACFEYDGSTWTSVNAANLAARTRQSFGIQTAGAMVGGFQATTSTYTNATEEYDGTNWTTVTAAPTNLSGSTCMGTQTAAIVGVGGAPTNVVTMLAYDGTNWTSSPSMNNARSGAGAGGTGATNTAGLVFGGSPYSPTAPATAEKWDGTSFTNSPASLTTARYGAGISNGNTNGIMVGGYQGTAFQSVVEEFNSSQNVITAAAWASGGSLNTGRTLGGSAITSGTSGIVFGGSSPYTGKTESYDGSSFSETGDMNTARGYLSGFGTSTAAVAAGGYNAPNNPQSLVEEWNGSAWSEETNLPAARKSAGNCGTLTAGLIFGGSSAQPYGPNIVNTTFEYNGSSWTTGGTLPEAKGQASSGGTQTAAFYAGGRTAPGRSAKTAFYNGSSWSEGADVATISPSSGGLGATGTTSAGLGTSGDNLTNIYDGTAWATSPNYSTARNRGFGGATASDALLVGGYSPSLTPNYTNNTEEFNEEIETLNVETLTQS